MNWFGKRHVHDWRYLTAVHYYDISYGLRKPSVMGAKQCITCGETTEYSIWGGGHPATNDLNARFDIKRSDNA